MNTQEHWETIYTTKAPHQVGWYKEHLDLSLQMIRGAGIKETTRLIDVGGGAATLVDDLVALGFRGITVLDISGAALELSRKRLGENADQVTWIQGDVTRVELPRQEFDLWHDRAVFHFLTQSQERQRYVQNLQRALRPGGQAIIATFALDGLPLCSGLPVVRYGAESLLAEVGEGFELIESVRETHYTPSGTEQRYEYFRLLRKPV